MLKRATSKLKERSTKFGKRLVSGIATTVLALSPIAAPLISAAKAYAADTGYSVPAAAHTPNDWDTNAVANVQSDDGAYAEDNDGQEQGYANFNLVVPADVDIEGIVVAARAKSTDNSGCSLGVRLSWNNGVNYTGSQTEGLSDNENSETFGGSNDTWGRTWALSDFSNANFVVKIQDVDPGSNCSNDATTKVDKLEVKVYYSEPQKNDIEDWCGPYDGGVKFDDPSDDTIDGITADFSFDDEEVDITTDGTKTIELVVVKAGSSGGNGLGGNQVYDTPPFTDLTAPGNKDISHVIVCYDNIQRTGDLKVVKDVVNDNGGSKTYADFTFKINGGDTPRSFDATTSPDGEKVITLPAGTDFTVTEVEANTGGYATSYSGTCDGTIVEGQTQVCNITNDDQAGTLIVKKVVVNDNGGAKEADDFSFSVNGGSSTAFEADGQNNLTVNAGSYDVTETPADGYATTYDNCEDVNVANGETETCTVTNDDIQPKLTVTKVVINDNGGGAQVADFPLFVDATGVTSGVQNGFNGGDYTVSETNQPGYGATITGDCAADGTITLYAGDVKSCTITNNDVAPILTVIKYVTNDDGGLLGIQDFALFVGATQVTSGAPNVFNAGDYTVSETNQPGYAASAWGGDCAADGTIVLTVGGNYTCSITNDDEPGTLIVKKVVVNDNGGGEDADDFSFSVNGGPSAAFETDGQNDLTVAAGKYTVTETPADGYATTYDNCEDVNVANGETETCTVTNDDIAPTLKIVKKTLPGETDQTFDFTSEELGGFDLGGGQYKLFNDNLQAGSYTVTEEASEGWKLVYIACEGTAYATEDNFVTIRLGIGDQAVCEFTNEKLSAIDGFKFEDVNINGQWDEGEPTLEGWTITLTEFCLNAPAFEQLVIDLYNCEDAVETSTVTDENGYYRFENLSSGLYIVCEELQDGWVQTYPWGEDENNCHFIELGGTGDEQQADFGNFQKATVEGSKFNDINGNHIWDENEPGLKGWEITLTKKCAAEEQILTRAAECEDETWTATTDENGAYSFPDLLPGEYTVCETQKDKWGQTFPQTEDGCHEFVIDESGQAVVADFGNKAKPQVLGEELVNTGSTSTAGLIFGLSILGLALLTIRRKASPKS